jgi:PmbA protein
MRELSPSTRLHDFTDRAFSDLSKSSDVDQLELYCSSNRIRGLRIVNNEIHESKLIVDSGVGVRVLKDGFTGYASLTDLSAEGVREAYDRSVKVASSKMGERENVTFAKPPSEGKIVSTSFLDDRLDKLMEEELAGLGKRMIDSALSHDKRVYDCSGSITLVSYEFSVINSNGVDSSDKGGYAYATLTSMAKDGQQIAQGFDTLVTKKHPDLVQGMEEIGEKATDMSIRSLGPRQPQSGRYDMIFTPTCLHPTMRNLGLMSNGRRVQDGLSMFAESLGKRVASEIVNIVEDGRFEDGLDACSIDDEGLPTKRTAIIEEGLLKSFIHDFYTASKSGVQSTGNGFRVWTQVGGSTLEGKRYDFPPTCSSVNFMLLPGDSKEDELIQDTKRGVLIGWTRYERLLNSKTGAFTANARSGNFMIENGEIKYPVHGFRIHDSYMNLLKSIDGIANKAEQKGHWGMAAISPSFRSHDIQIIST